MIKREAIYKRELNHSYMVLRCSGTELTERYDYRIPVSYTHLTLPTKA